MNETEISWTDLTDDEIDAVLGQGGDRKQRLYATAWQCGKWAAVDQLWRILASEPRIRGGDPQAIHAALAAWAEATRAPRAPGTREDG